jgi:glycosyltransferase involved in cell wall biosynthesis
MRKSPNEIQKEHSIAVVICCYNEGKQIAGVIEAVPKWVDRIIVVDDCSTDNTVAVVSEYLTAGTVHFPLNALAAEFTGNSLSKRADQVLWKIFEDESKALIPSQVEGHNPDYQRVILVKHLKNGGKGAALATGYRVARDLSVDVVVTIDGDGQMDCDEMHLLVDPIVDGRVDYVKGNRLAHRSASRMIPKIRLLGNSVLSILTKVASGYWSISDSQTGYTAISKEALRKIKLDKIFQRYGVPNDILIKLNVVQATVGEVVIRPVYGVGEQSKMKIWKVIPTISWLLFRLFLYRLWQKYFIRSFHPLFLLYSTGLVCLVFSAIFGGYLLHSLYIEKIRPPVGYYFLEGLTASYSMLTLLFAMWMDVEDNRRLQTLRQV